jgi:hypothetical protein
MHGVYNVKMMMMMIENRALVGIFRSKMQKVIGEW